MTEQNKSKYEVHVQWGVKIPMRDGIRLNATLYLPESLDEARPSLFSLTPYISASDHEDAIFLAESGYPYLAIDVRGRGNSEGEFEPFFRDPADGHDIVEWVASQPWCNGKIGMRGISYVGFTQWAALRGEASHLATIVPAAPCWVGFDYPMRFNVFFTFLAQWSISTWGKTSQRSLRDDLDFWKKRYIGFLESGLPYKKLDEYFGFESPAFREWVKHPYQDEYWDRANPTPEQFARLKMPILSLTGQLDGDQPGTLEFYRNHLRHAGDQAQHYLVIGPWDHPGVHTPKPEIMGMKYGPDSLVDMKKLHHDWYAWTMEDGPKPDFLKGKVAHYVTGSERWRYADTLDEVTHKVETLFLDSVINPTDIFQSGTLTKRAAKRPEPDQYVYDPRDLSRPRLEATLTDGNLGEDVPASVSKDMLVYHTEPFEQDTEVSGFFKLTAWLSIDQPDTDFLAHISEIDLLGHETPLTSQVLRARHREDLRSEQLIGTTDPLPYQFDRFFFVSRCIRKGRRLRLAIGANHSIHWQKNYNSDKPVADQTMDDARTVTVRLFHDDAHPSALRVPIGRPE